MEIPKKIHYCWFGGAPLNDMAIRCIESWKRYFPDYEIIQWNENNFDVTAYDFMRKAHADKKWAFVSDVARLKIIYDYGGLYFDTDVEVIAPYDDILASDAEGFAGFEKTKQVNTGLGFGAVKGSQTVKMLLDDYVNMNYDEYRHNLSQVACTVLTTKSLVKNDMLLEDRKQKVNNIDIYPSDYFSPMDYYTGKLRKTENAHSIHWYSASWKSDTEREQYRKLQKLYSVFGRHAVDTVSGIISCIRREKLVPYIRKRLCKYFCS